MSVDMNSGFYHVYFQARVLSTGAKLGLFLKIPNGIHADLPRLPAL